MPEQFKLMILVNILLGLLFLVLNYVYYYFANRFEGLVLFGVLCG